MANLFAAVIRNYAGQDVPTAADVLLSLCGQPRLNHEVESVAPNNRYSTEYHSTLYKKIQMILTFKNYASLFYDRVVAVKIRQYFIQFTYNLYLLIEIQISITFINVIP